MWGIPEFLSRLDAETLIHVAAKFEFYLFAFTFLIVVAILSLGASFFFIRTALEHAFPGLIELANRILRRERVHKTPTVVLVDAAKPAD